MKVTAEAQHRPRANSLLQLVKKPSQIIAVIKVPVVRVGRGHHVLDAILRCHAAHGLGGFPGLRAVVNFWENMGMNINHGAG